MQNEKMKNYEFLKDMYSDGYFPDFLVDKGRDILMDVCNRIESEKIETLEALYVVTHQATEKFNDLNEEFGENGSEIETIARDSIGESFQYIAEVYGFVDADSEELIAPRDW